MVVLYIHIKSCRISIINRRALGGIAQGLGTQDALPKPSFLRGPKDHINTRIYIIV